MDGADKETYEEFRKEGDFERTVSNLKLLIKRRKEQKAIHPVINLRMVVTSDNEKQIPEMKKFAENVVNMIMNERVGQTVIFDEGHLANHPLSPILPLSL